MKTKITIVMLSGLFAGSLALWAQDNPQPAGSDSAAIAATGSAPVVAAAETTGGAAAPEATTPPAAPTTETPAAEPAAASTPDTNAAAVTAIPLIVMDDVPLTDAIKNLARQAGLNYMLDPKLPYGQPGEGGKVTAQPVVSIRWENITAEQALMALLSNYGLQLVDDPKTHISRITVKDPTAPDPLVTKIIQLKYASPSNILGSAQAALTDKRSRIMGDVRTSQLVALATEKEIANLDIMVARLDIAPKQVLIEAKLLETSMNPSTIKGIDWSGTLQAQHVAFGNNVLGGQFNRYSTKVEADPNNPLIQNVTVGPNNLLPTIAPKLLVDTARGFNPGTAFLDADGVAAVISFINQNSEAKVISAPRTVTMDNEPSVITVTRASPIINVTAGTANTTGGSQITYTNLGVILNVTPRISANNQVNLKVIPEVSRIFGTVTKIIQGQTFQADEYDVRKIETQVMIPSAHTLVLGGLVQDDQRTGNTKVPFFGDLPLIGRAFRHESKSRQKSNLLVFITPTIVEEGDFHPTQTDFLKNTAPDPNDPEWNGPEWSAWDSGKPLDWSKPVLNNAPKQPSTY